MNMHGTHGCVLGLEEQKGDKRIFQGLLYRRGAKCRESCLFLWISQWIMQVEQYLYTRHQKEALEKLPNEYTIQTYNTYNVLYEGHLLSTLKT